MSDIEITQFDSAILGRKRKIRVWKPPVYTDDSAVRFPLLIQQDGQMAFTERDEDLPYGSWGIDRWLDTLARDPDFRLPVVVAIDNSPRRMHEYFPLTHDFATYQRFLLEELLPWIRAEFRVTHETAVMGSSMGGLVSFALAANNPAQFQAAGCISPWFELEQNKYVHEVLRPMRHKPAIRVYMDSGISDWRGLDDGHRGMLMARQELLRLGFITGVDLDWMVDTWFPTAAELENSRVRASHRTEALTNQHNEFQWNRRLERPLRFLFQSPAE